MHLMTVLQWFDPSLTSVTLQIAIMFIYSLFSLSCTKGSTILPIFYSKNSQKCLWFHKIITEAASSEQILTKSDERCKIIFPGLIYYEFIFFMGSRDSIQEFFFSLSPRVVLLDRSFVKLALIQIVKYNAGNLLSYKDFQYLNYIKLLLVWAQYV